MDIDLQYNLPDGIEMIHPSIYSKRIRILDKPYFYQIFLGVKPGLYSVRCHDTYDMSIRRAMYNEFKPKTRVFFKILDRDDQKFKLLETDFLFLKEAKQKFGKIEGLMDFDLQITEGFTSGWNKYDMKKVKADFNKEDLVDDYMEFNDQINYNSIIPEVDVAELLSITDLNIIKEEQGN